MISPLLRPFDLIEAANENYGGINEQKRKEGTNGVGLNFVQGVCIVINVVMGCGFLGLPRLVGLTGVALGPIIMVAVCCTLTITTAYEAEVMCRAQAMVEGKRNPSGISDMRRNPLYSMRINRSFSMVEMCELLSGNFLKRIYNSLIVFYLFSSMLAYTIVFSTAMSHYAPVPLIFQGQTCTNHEHDDGCIQLRNFYIALYAVFVIPLSMIGVKEQVSFQVIMTALRFCVAVTMAGTCLHGISSGVQIFGTSVPMNQNLKLFSFCHTFQMLTPALFAQNGNAFVSVVVRDLQDKNSIGKVYRAGMFVTCALYTFLGLSLAIYLGDAIPQTANVLWVNYTGGYDSHVWWVQAVAFFVILFPALDVVSIFPLNGIAMAANMMASVYHDKVEQAENDKFIVQVFRFCCTAPPIILAIVVGDNLDKVLVYAGSCVIPMAMLIPPYLNFISQRVVQEKLGFTSSKTHLTSIFSGGKCLIAMGAIGSILLLVSIFQNATTSV